MLAYLPTYLYTCMPIYLPMTPSACLPFAYLETYVRTYPPSCLPAYLLTSYLSTYLHIYALNCLPWLKIKYNQNPTECLRILYLSTCLPVYALACLNTYLPAYLPTLL